MASPASILDDAEIRARWSGFAWTDANAKAAAEIVTDGTNRPYRCKIRPTAFSHLQAMDFMMKGHMLADTTAVLSAIDVVFGECDR